MLRLLPGLAPRLLRMPWAGVAPLLLPLLLVPLGVALAGLQLCGVAIDRQVSVPCSLLPVGLLVVMVVLLLLLGCFRPLLMGRLPWGACGSRHCLGPLQAVPVRGSGRLAPATEWHGSKAAAALAVGRQRRPWLQALPLQREPQRAGAHGRRRRAYGPPRAGRAPRPMRRALRATLLRLGPCEGARRRPELLRASKAALVCRRVLRGGARDGEALSATVALRRGSGI